MKRKIISFLLILTLVISAVPLTGNDFSEFAPKAKAAETLVSGDYEYSFGGDGVEISAYLGSATRISVPAEIEGLPVVSIGYRSFSNSENADKIELITLPSTVTTISGGAFSGMDNLKKINLNEGITHISSYAFAYCPSLVSLVLPNSVEYVGERLFDGCESLKEITWPGNDVEMDTETFYGSSIEKINLSEGMTTIYDNFFLYTKVTSVTVPSTVDLVMSKAFFNSNWQHTVENVTFLNCESLNLECLEHTNSPALKNVYTPDIFTDISHDLLNVYNVAYDDASGYWHLTYVGDYSSYEVHHDKSFDYILNENGEAVLIKYTGVNPYIVLPEDVGFPDMNYGVVTEIGSGTFTDTTVTKVIISDTIKRIGNYAFERCASLTTVEIPDSVTEIGNGAFYGCSALETLTLPETVTEIGPKAFKSCHALTTINWPSQVNYVPADAFWLCNSFNDFGIFENVEIIGRGAFKGCKVLVIDDFGDKIKRIGGYAFTGGTSDGMGGNFATINATTLPESLEYIGNRAFAHNPSVKEMTIPANVKYIDEGAFRYSALEQIEILGPITEIQDGTFSNTPINSIVLPNTIEAIGDHAFYRCKSLEEITIPDSVKTIGKSTFNGCSNLKGIDLPQSLAYIGESAFELCESITELVIPPNLTEIGVCAFGGLGIDSIHIPSNVKKIGMMAFSSCENVTEITIENGVESIGDRAFEWNKATEITIPESVRAIGSEIIGETLIETVYYNAIQLDKNLSRAPITKLPVFSNGSLKKIVFGENVKLVPGLCSYNSTALEEIVFSDSIEEIDYGAFWGCTALKTFTLPNSLKLIDMYAFADCTAIESLVIPDGVEEIKIVAFRNCTALAEITIPQSIKVINTKAFDGCTGVKILNFNAVNVKYGSTTETEIGDVYYSPFRTMTALETINIGSNVKEICDYAFCGVEGPVKVNLPANVTDIGKCAFAFSGITSITATDSLESIGEYAFYGCEGLENADWGKELMIIASGAFGGCSVLKEIYVPDTVSVVETGAFRNCSSLETVYMSVNVTYIPAEAFNNCVSLSSFTWNAANKLIGKLAFGGCAKLNEFDFANVEKLYDNSFAGSGVTAVMLGETKAETPSALEEIEAQSFMECDSLATLSIGGNVSSIKTQAFANCDNLETAIISDSVTEIAEDAFDGCEKLTIICNESSYAYAYASEQGIAVTTLVIAPIPNQTYTGFEIRPVLSVSFSGKPLSLNTDFTVSYSNNVNVGTAIAAIRGEGELKALASRANFTIVTRSIAAANVAEIAVQDYTGSEIKPELTVTDGAKILREGTDYTVTYKDNIESGTATVIIKGKGNYSGTKAVDFEIEQLDPIRNIINDIISFFNSIIAKIKAFFSQFVITRK